MKTKSALAVLSVFAIALTFCGCKTGIVTSKENQPVNETAAVSPEVSPVLPTAEPSMPTQTATPVSVGDLMLDSGSYTDESGNVYNYFYNLPEIKGADTEYLSSVNSAILDLKGTYVDREFECMANGLSIVVYKVSYSYVTYDGVTSILISVFNDWDFTEYFTFNISEDGSQVTNDQLLTMHGFTEDEFTETAKKLMGDSVSTGFDGSEELYNTTVSPDNCNTSMPMYIDENGNLCFVGLVYSPAGAGAYFSLFNTGK